MSNFGCTPTLGLSADMLTVDLTRELVLEARLSAPYGLVSDEVNEYIIAVANTHLLTSGEPRDIWVLAHSALLLPSCHADIEFMTDEEVAATLHEGETVAKGRLCGVEYVASAAFSGFGLRLFGVDLREPEPAFRESLFVPVDSVTLTLPAKRH